MALESSGRELQLCFGLHCNQTLKSGDMGVQSSETPTGTISGNDALLGPGVNPLEGSPNVKLRKLGPKGTLPASNSRKGVEGRVGSQGIRLGRGTSLILVNLHPKTNHGRLV
jgi:hypothetical protein